VERARGRRIANLRRKTLRRLMPVGRACNVAAAMAQRAGLCGRVLDLRVPARPLGLLVGLGRAPGAVRRARLSAAATLVGPSAA
jgi:hypothetical protein